MSGEADAPAASPAPPSADPAPRVSVILPVYNGERYLRQTLASVLAQTLRDLELLLVEDGSTDASPAIAAAAAAEDPRITVLRRPHTGVSAGRNHALSIARAPYAALMDHDDLCRPDRLAVQAAFLDENPDVAVLGSHALYIGESGRTVGVLEFGPCSREEYRQLREQHLPFFSLASSTMFRTEVVRAAGGFRTAMQPSEDTDLWTRIGDDHVILILPRHLVAYRLHAESTSVTSFFAQRERNDLHAENARRRHADMPELTPEEYHRRLLAQQGGARLRRCIHWRARYLYRVGGGLLAAGRLRGALYDAAAAVLAPAMVTRRLRPHVAARLRRRPED